MFIALMIVMVPYVYSYPQAHRVVHIKYVVFLYLNYTSVKWLKKTDGFRVRGFSWGDENILKVILLMVA